MYKYMMKACFLKSILLGVGLGTSLSTYAACTLNEAKIALQKGNPVRGLALMKMAARDGDQRANQYLAQLAHTQGGERSLELRSQTLVLDTSVAEYGKHSPN